MRITFRFMMAAMLLGLSACGTSPAISLYETYVGPSPSRSNFPVCHGFSCSYTEQVSLTDSEWARIQALFATPPQNAEEERARLAQAIGEIEKIVGPKAGTQNDRRRAPNFGERGQQDCIDEAVNTTTYLNFIKQDGMMAYHDIGKAAVRGMIVDGKWPSNTATIIERESGMTYTMDSFFHKNGKPAEVVELDFWMTGWRPERHADEVER